MLRALRAPIAPPLRLVPAPPVAPTARWIELTIAWGDTTLHVAHLASGERFVLGDVVPPGVRGFVTPGAPRDLLVRHGEGSAVVVPDLRSASFFEGGRVRNGREVLARGALIRENDHASEALFPLGAERRCRFTIDGLEVRVAVVAAAARPARVDFALRRSHWAILLVSLALHAALLAAIFGLPSVDTQASAPSAATAAPAR